MPYKKRIENRVDKYRFSLSNIREDDVKSLAEALKGTDITILELNNNNFGFNSLKYLTQALRDTKIRKLCLRNNNITDEGVKYLSESLHDTHITLLNLSNNNFGCNGLKYLAKALRDTQISELHLGNNNIMDDGVKYLAESLQNTHITTLNLSKNKIGIDAAYYLNTMLCNTKIDALYLDIYFSEDGDPSKYILQRTFVGTKHICITLNNNKLGIKGAQYLNKYFQKIAIHRLELHIRDLEADDAQYLSEAFQDIKIKELIMSRSHIMQHNGIQYLVQAFKGSQIAKLSVVGQEMGATGARYIADFLREVKVLDLHLGYIGIGDEGMKYLAPALENSDIMYINLASNDITAEGARYLSKILRNSKIVKISLRSNSISTDGARYLAQGLPDSQVALIDLDSNDIQYAGYRCFIDVVESTNISLVHFYDNNIEAGLDEGTELWLRTLPRILKRNSTSVAQKICHVFRESVSLNTISNEFEFIAPRKNTLSPVDIDDYAFLIRTLTDNPNCKVHIFHEMCKIVTVYDLNVMNKINEFIAIIQNKFCKFFDGKLPDFVESFVDFDYVNLVKQFDDMKQCEIVQYLLLHRVLYYVDENQEILHPYIYKMLHKHSMPLYSEQLEPNKKGEIIAYFKNHPEIYGAQEIIDLLGSGSFEIK